jgi:hypothetical protein
LKHLGLDLAEAEVQALPGVAALHDLRGRLGRPHQRIPSFRSCRGSLEQTFLFSTFSGHNGSPQVGGRGRHHIVGPRRAHEKAAIACAWTAHKSFAITEPRTQSHLRAQRTLQSKALGASDSDPRPDSPDRRRLTQNMFVERTRPALPVEHPAQIDGRPVEMIPWDVCAGDHPEDRQGRRRGLCGPPADTV